MKKQKNKKTTKNKERAKTSITYLIIAIIVVIISIVVFTVPNYARKSINSPQQKNYIIGNIYTPNASANMLDYLYNGKNIVVSPINANTSLALFYNGADNTTKKELKKYFNKDIQKTNEIIVEKINRLQNTNANIRNANYEKYLKEFAEKKYAQLRIKDIDKMSQKEREELILIIRKIEMYQQQKQTKLKEKDIEKYELSQKEKKYNGYTLKEKIDHIMVNYEIYQIENKIVNYNEIYYQENKKTKIIDEYSKTINSMYKTNITAIDFKSKDSNSLVNNNLQLNTNNSISRVINDELSNESIISINSLLFNYEWENGFASESIIDEEFVDLNEKHYMVDMMFGEETVYLENENATGFIKNFEGGKYSFVGILPKEEGKYQIGELDIENLLASKKDLKTYIGIPIFTIESLNHLNTLFENYNVKELFTSKANLHEMSNSNLYLDTIFQKETITIGKYGTVEGNTKTASLSTNALDETSKKVILNRSFAFLIMDNETQDILIIGRLDHP